jgi:hypothetical protein
MLSKLSVALLLAASPVQANSSSQPAQEFEVKKVCKTVLEVGSRIPQRTCTTKRVPIEKPGVGNPAANSAADAAAQPR